MKAKRMLAMVIAVTALTLGISQAQAQAYEVCTYRWRCCTLGGVNYLVKTCYNMR